MSTTQRRLAASFAKNIVTLQGRNDFGGLYHQAVRDFTEAAFAFSLTGTTLYVLPNGRRVKDFGRAVSAWAAEAGK